MKLKSLIISFLMLFSGFVHSTDKACVPSDEVQCLNEEISCNVKVIETFPIARIKLNKVLDYKSHQTIKGISNYKFETQEIDELEVLSKKHYNGNPQDYAMYSDLGDDQAKVSTVTLLTEQIAYSMDVKIHNELTEVKDYTDEELENMGFKKQVQMTFNGDKNHMHFESFESSNPVLKKDYGLDKKVNHLVMEARLEKNGFISLKSEFSVFDLKPSGESREASAGLEGEFLISYDNPNFQATLKLENPKFTEFYKITKRISVMGAMTKLKISCK